MQFKKRKQKKNACVVNTRLSFSVKCPRSWRERRRLLNPTQIIFPRLSSLTPVPLWALDARKQIKIPFCGNKSAPEQTPPPPPPRVGWEGGGGLDGMGCRDSHGLTAIQLTQPGAYDSPPKSSCVLLQKTFCIGDGGCALSCVCYDNLKITGGGWGGTVCIFTIVSIPTTSS